MLTFIETPRFQLLRDEYLGDDEGYRSLQNALLESPHRGDVIPGCGGLRKMRWPDSRRGKGRRGGLRIIYLYVEAADTIVFFALYDKDETTDLSPDEKKKAANLADSTRREIMALHHLSHP
jgi:hypothetical protein